jgi:hypothetical protein
MVMKKENTRGYSHYTILLNFVNIMNDIRVLYVYMINIIYVIIIIIPVLINSTTFITFYLQIKQF